MNGVLLVLACIVLWFGGLFGMGWSITQDVRASAQGTVVITLAIAFLVGMTFLLSTTLGHFA